jgi:hypothetical protein
MTLPTSCDSASNLSRNGKQISNRKKTGARHKRAIFKSVVAVGLAGCFLAHDAAAVDYTIVPAGSTLDWNTATSWDPSTGTPGTTFGDTALVTGAFGGTAKTVDISSTLANGLTGLTLGDTSGTGTTTIQTLNDSSLLLSAATINSAGADGAINIIAAPITSSGNMTFALASTNNLTITGKITQTSGGIYSNQSTKTVTLGDIDSSGPLTITNANTVGTKTVLNGAISNGALTFTGAVNSAGYEINGTNTYAGNTVLNGNATYLLGSDSAFGTGLLQIGNTNSQPLILDTQGGDRRIENSSVELRRLITYSGANNITFAGDVVQNNGNVWTNNIAPGKFLNFAGSLATSRMDDGGRNIRIAGTGTTMFSGVLKDTNTPVNNSLGYAVNEGTGTFVVTGNVSLQGGFRITSSGTVQLGDGGTTGTISPLVVDGFPAKRSIVSSSNGASGSFAVNRSDALFLGSTINGGIGLKQIGTGALTVDTANYNTGANTIGDGITATTLIVTAGSVAVTSQSGTVAAAAAAAPDSTNLAQVVTGLTDTSGLKPGQPVYTGIASAVTYILSVDSPTQVTLAGTAFITAGDQPLNFGAGSALGTAAATTTINNNGTLAGTGVISGTVTANAGGRIAPGVNTVGNFGSAGTLTTGVLNLADTSHLDFDLASTAVGPNDLISTSNQNLLLGAVNFTFYGLTPGVLETGTAYHLISVGTGIITGDTSGFTTTFDGTLPGYEATYSIDTVGGYVNVTFAAVPEPASLSLLVFGGVAGLFLLRRKRAL